MVFNKCMGCDNLVPQTEGKKAKLYCSSICRQKVWQDKRREELRIFRETSKQNPLPAGYVRIKNVKAVTKDGKEVSLSKPKDINPSEIQAKISEVKERIKDDPRSKMRCAMPESFMGHEIPKELKGIELSIWKSEIKEKNK